MARVIWEERLVEGERVFDIAKDDLGRTGGLCERGYGRRNQGRQREEERERKSAQEGTPAASEHKCDGSTSGEWWR